MSEKLRQAVTAIKSGDKETGRRLLTELVETDERNENAWLWLAFVVNEPAKQCEYLERVLAINPNNRNAQMRLSQLAQNATSLNPPLRSNSDEQTLKEFNQNFLDIRYPVEFAGTRQPDFSIAHTYKIDKQQVSLICEKLYDDVFEKLEAGKVGKITYQKLNYLDCRYRTQEPPRRYIVIEQNTNRGTKMSIFIRFLPFGDNLYVAVDSYVLGSLDWFAMVWRCIVAAVPLAITLPCILFLIPGFFGMVVESFQAPLRGEVPQIGGAISLFFCSSPVFCCLVPFLLLFVLPIWVKVFRSFKQHRNLQLALRQNFNFTPNDQSFNADDILMFFKSSLTLVIFSVREVLEKNGLPIETLDEFAKNVNNVVNISSGGGLVSIINSAIGGRSNTIST